MGKRGQSQGTVSHRRAGRWEGALTLPGTGGARKRAYAATEEHALALGEPLSTARQIVAA